jgi:hypothetical protein
VIATIGASPGATLTHAVKGAFNITGAIDVTLTKAHVDVVLMADFIIWETLQEVAVAKV